MAVGSSHMRTTGSIDVAGGGAPDGAQAWLDDLADSPLIAILRAEHASAYAPVVETLLEAGVRNIELTLSTAGVLEALPELRRRCGTEAALGVGTVTRVEEAEALIDAGARFLVTPVMRTDVVRAASAAGVAVVPGGLTPSELYAGWEAGAPAVKIFPASEVTPGYLAQLRGPFPLLQVIPSGGIGQDEAEAWLRAGAVAVGMGGPLVRDAFAGGSRAELRERARKLVAALSAARGAGQ